MSEQRDSQESEEASERKFIIGICAGIGFCVGFVILCCCLWKMCCSDSTEQKQVKIINNRLKDIKTSREVTSRMHEETEIPDYSARRPRVVHRRPLPSKVENMELTHNGAISSQVQNGFKRKRMESLGNENANGDSGINQYPTSKVSHRRVPRRQYNSQDLGESSSTIDMEILKNDSNRRSKRSKRTKGGIKNPAFEIDQQDIQPENDNVHQLSADYAMGDYKSVARSTVDSCSFNNHSPTVVRSHRRDISNVSNHNQKEHLEEDSEEDSTAYGFYRKNRNARPKKIFQT